MPGAGGGGRGGEETRSGTEHTVVKRLNRYFCLEFHLPVREKWAKMYKSVSQHNYLSIFLKTLRFFAENASR